MTTLTPTIIILISAMLHASWNALLKSSRDKEAASLAVLSVAGLFSLVLALVQQEPWSPLFDAALPWSVSAGVFEGLYFYCLARTLTTAPLGPSYTVIRGGAMLLVWAISIPILGERLTVHGTMGALLVLVGVPLVTPRFIAQKRSGSPLYALRFAFASATFVAGYHLCYGQALQRNASPAPLFTLAMSVAVPVLVLLQKKISWPRKAESKRLLAAGLICAGAFLMFLYGLSRSAPGITISLRNTSILFAQLFAWLLGERMTRLQWLGVMLSASGASLLTL